MFKKAFQIVLTFGLLVGAYQAYLVGFAALTTRVVVRSAGDLIFVHEESKTERLATRLAVESFGPGHWAADKKLKIRMNDVQRGFFMYAGDYKPLDDGKKFEFWPFAIIWMDKDGKGRKTATSARAQIELNEALKLIKPGGEAMHVVEATLENEVVLRDDKGTLLDQKDDLVVGPLPSITYTEKTDPPQIFSHFDIHLVDRDLDLTGHDLTILLRKREGAGGPAGFDARTAILKRNVHIVATDAGKGGVLPGTARGTATGGATPIDLKADGEMRIDFPPKPGPIRKDFVGPQVPEGPTIANFQRNVVVIRGTKLPDILNSDTLKLTFMPTPRESEVADPFLAAMILGAATITPAANRIGGPASPSGPLTELALSEANARGYAVFLESEAQGTKAKCNELIYKKLAPYAPDETYLRADLGKQITVDKVDHAGPAPGQGPITGMTTVLATDAKIFDDGKGGAASTIIARGPGLLESRPDIGKPVEQSASWDRELIMRTTAIPADASLFLSKDDPTPTRRQITLNGRPKLVDHLKAMRLEARSSVVVSLRPSSKAAKGPAPKADPAKKGALGGSGASQIEWLQARDDVRLTSPGKTMIARDALDAPFEEIVAEADAPPAAPIVAPTPPPAAGQSVAKADDKPKAAPIAAPEKAEPSVTVTAHRVWAKIRQGVNGAKSEIAEARLRGAVKFHQDPEAGKVRGIDVVGEALDLETVSKGRMKFKVFDSDPSALGQGGARLASRGDGQAALPRFATVDTDDYAIRGPIIGLDQSQDFFWVIGRGSITQLADHGLLAEKGVEAKGKKVPMVVEWSDEMRFYGRAKDPEGRPAGKAMFFGEVKAKMTDGVIVADVLDTYTDRPVSLVAPVRPTKTGTKPGIKAASGETSLIDRMFTTTAGVNAEDVPPGGDKNDAKPELAYLDARTTKERPSGTEPGVLAISARKDPSTGQLIELQRIVSSRIIYDKRTGDYQVPGAGTVYLWRRGPAGTKRPGLPGGPLPTARRPEARPIANGPKAIKKDDAPEKAYGRWELTKIKFLDKMRGRFGVGKDRDVTEPRTADFYGGVQVINAPVSGLNDLNFDSRPADFKSITADRLRVVDFPPPPDVKDVPARHTLTAEGNAHARTNTHAMAADLLTYDSDTDVFHAYGQEGREVVITDQAHPGQPGSLTRGEAAVYNHKTGAANLVSPSTISYLDGNSGIRPGVESPPGPASAKPRNNRPKLRPPPSGNLERKGFGGGR